MPFFGGIIGDAGSCGGVGDAAAPVSVVEGIVSDLVYRRGLPGWRLVGCGRLGGLDIRGIGTPSFAEAKHVSQSECIFSPF